MVASLETANDFEDEQMRTPSVFAIVYFQFIFQHLGLGVCETVVVFLEDIDDWLFCGETEFWSWVSSAKEMELKGNGRQTFCVQDEDD